MALCGNNTMFKRTGKRVYTGRTEFHDTMRAFSSSPSSVIVIALYSCSIYLFPRYTSYISYTCEYCDVYVSSVFVCNVTILYCNGLTEAWQTSLLLLLFLFRLVYYFIFYMTLLLILFFSTNCYRLFEKIHKILKSRPNGH